MNKITLDFFLAKSKTAIRGLFVLVAFLLMNTQTSWGQTYEQVITIDGLVDGDYLVVADGSTNDGIMLNTITSGSTPYINRTSVTNPGSSITTGYMADNVFQIAVVSGKITIYNATVGYVSWGRTGNTGNSANFFSGTVADSERWTPTVSGGLWTLTNVGTVARSLQWNNSSPRFACYTSTQVRLKLYKKAVSGSTPPSLTPDSSSNTVDNNIDISFTDDATWRAAVTAVKVGATTLIPTTDYVLSVGNLQLKPSGLNTLLTTSGSKSISIEAAGYTNATVTQVINAGAPTTNSTATISAALAPNTARTITATAKDQYNNLVSGYTFGYDVTVTNNTGTTTESYTIDGSAFTTTSTGNPVTASTNASGVATFTAVLPTTIDSSDGLSIQVQLADDTTNVGTAFSFAQLAAQTITFGALTPVTYGDTTFGLTATASSTLPVTYASSNTAVATVSGSTVTIVGAGSTNISASQAGDSSFNAAENVIQGLTVNAKALTLPDAAAASRAYNALLTTNITGTLTGIINADDVTFDGAFKGTFADANVADGIAVTSACTLAGTKAGNYTLTQPTGLTANITQASQTITFNTLTNKVVGDASFTLSGTASSTLTVAYASSNTAVATVSGNTVTIVGAGSTNITVSQAGNGNYTAAADVVQSLTVTAAPIVAWQFGNPAALGTEVTYNATTNNTNLNTVALSRGAGIAATALGRAFGSNTWSATGTKTSAKNENEFFQFAITVKPGYKLNLTALDATIRRTSTAPNAYIWAYSTDGTNFTEIGAEVSYTGTSEGVSQPQIDLSAIPALQNVENITTLTFRLYAWGGTSTTATFSIGRYATNATTNSLTISGTTEVATSTTWNGTAWTSGAPSASIDAIIDGNLSSTGTLDTKNLIVNNTRTLTVATGSVTVAEALVNNGTITVENNANVVQTAVANTNSGSGTATVNRNSAAIKRLDYTMWSSPVSGSQTLEGFSPNTSRTPNRFYTYNGGTAFANIATTSVFTPGMGYLIRMPNDASTSNTSYAGQFTGTLNNGTITLSGLTSDRFYSVGNPYPSTLDADAFLTTNPGTLYFWRKTNAAVGGAYATYNSVGPVAAASGSGSEVPNGTIQVGQGFIAKTGMAATSLVFTNAMRLGTASSQFFKTKAPVAKSRIWLDLTATGGLFSQALVGYLDGATVGVDNGYDGKYLSDSATDAALTSIVDGGEYTIQGRPAFDVTDVVALGFNAGAAGDFTIAINKKDGLLAAQDVYLVDSKTGIETDLNAGSYTFSAEAGVDNTRFSLKYQKTLKVDVPVFNDNSVKVYKINGAIYVNSTSKTIKTIEVYDVEGRLIAQQKNVNAATATIQNVKAIRQMLIVKVSADDNSVVSKKVLN